MAIPKEIREIPRPKNTIVVSYGKDKNLYGVRIRIGCKRDGKRNIPQTGPTIGHIRDGRYIPTGEDPAFAPTPPPAVELKDWANAELCDRLFADILGDLEVEYPPDMALKIWSVAVLRVCNRGANDYELKEMYDESFLSVLRPGAALSKNTVSELHKDVGHAFTRIVRFMRRRAEAIGADASVLLDGTLKSNESRVNSLSDFSRKAKTKGTRDISVLYAFDLDRMEPVCSKCYPGNMLDVTAYEDFIRECGVKRGVLVADKGFPESAAHGHISANPDLHYLNPIRRNATFIRTHRMLEFEGVLPDRDGVSFKKAKAQGKDKWLYSFRDAARAAAEERGWLAKAKEDGYDHAEYEEARRSFGTIVLECDLDLDPGKVYKMYEERWEIEIVMRYYKSACEFDETRVHGDYSVIGSEFCDFLASVLTFRLIKAFDKAGLLKKMNYSRIMSLLKRAKKVRVGEDGDWRLVRINPKLEKMLAALGLTPSADVPQRRKPGRPPKLQK